MMMRGTVRRAAIAGRRGVRHGSSLAPVQGHRMASSMVGLVGAASIAAATWSSMETRPRWAGFQLTHCNAATDYQELERLDSLFEHRGVEGNLSACLDGLMKMYEDGELDKAELCHRLARANYNLISSNDPFDAKYNGTKEKKQKCAEDALKFAEESLDCAPVDFRSHYWCGIAIQAVGDFKGTKYTISNLNRIREHFEKAAELNDADGTTQYCLGSWCYSLADLSWVSRKLAATLFATPPTSTFEEALQFFLKAEEVEPRFWNKNALMIAKTYVKLGDKAKAKEWAQITSERPCANAEDKQIRQEALDLLKKL